jgi:hypothetical protein
MPIEGVDCMAGTDAIWIEDRILELLCIRDFVQIEWSLLLEVRSKILDYLLVLGRGESD